MLACSSLVNYDAVTAEGMCMEHCTAMYNAAYIVMCVVEE